MSDIIEQAVTALNARMGDQRLDGTAKFVIDGEGAVMIDESGARAGDEEADVTLTASEDTFREIMGGDLDPTAAFMSGRLMVDGDMGLAMKLGSVIS